MHAIGAVCLMTSIPVAPLHFVKRFDGEWRGIFESDPSERLSVLPHYSTLYVAAREHRYIPAEFEMIEEKLRSVIPPAWTPHALWHFAIYIKTKALPHQTALERAMKVYKAELAEASKTPFARRI